jgi:hypothetical protein
MSVSETSVGKKWLSTCKRCGSLLLLQLFSHLLLSRPFSSVLHEKGTSQQYSNLSFCSKVSSLEPHVTFLQARQIHRQSDILDLMLQRVFSPRIRDPRMTETRPRLATDNIQTCLHPTRLHTHPKVSKSRCSQLWKKPRGVRVRVHSCRIKPLYQENCPYQCRRERSKRLRGLGLRVSNRERKNNPRSSTWQSSQLIEMSFLTT